MIQTGRLDPENLILTVVDADSRLHRRYLAAGGLGFIIGGKFDLRLVNVLWAEETIRAKGRILQRRPEGDRVRAEVEVWCEKSDGTKTIVGTASALEL